MVVCIFSLFRILEPFGCFDRELKEFAFAIALMAESNISHPAKMARNLAEVERFYVEVGGVDHANQVPGYVLDYQVYDLKGNLLVQAGDMPVGFPVMDSGDEPYSVPGCACKHHGWFHDLQAPGGTKNWRAFVAQDPERQVVVQVGEAYTLRGRRIFNIIMAASAFFAFVYVLLIVMTWFLIRRVLRPVNELARSISGRPRGNLEPVKPSLVFQETAPLVDEINTLLAGTRQHLQEERGFLADAAHELRTPLAAVGMQAQALVMAKTEAGRSSALTELNAGLKRVSHLAQQLLTSARVDVRGCDHFKQEDLASLARERAASLSLLAMQKAIEMELDAPETLFTVIDRFGMGSVIDNLIDNAIRYTPEGGRIDIRLGQSAEGIYLDVQDTGPGIPVAEREKVLQRFYRVPGNLVPGSGLGLSIVQRVVEQHGGRLEFGTGPEDLGLHVHVVLPEKSPCSPP